MPSDFRVDAGDGKDAGEIVVGIQTDTNCVLEPFAGIRYSNTQNVLSSYDALEDYSKA